MRKSRKVGIGFEARSETSQFSEGRDGKHKKGDTKILALGNKHSFKSSLPFPVLIKAEMSTERRTQRSN
jgi:hypothetical protein